jgi:hypothetical protein
MMCCPCSVGHPFLTSETGAAPFEQGSPPLPSVVGSSAVLGAPILSQGGDGINSYDAILGCSTLFSRQPPPWPHFYEKMPVIDDDLIGAA